MTTWRDKQAAKPDPYQVALNELHRHLGFRMASRPAMVDAIEAYEDATIIANQCDEPECEQEATCGFPVEGGYRRTCGKHYER